MSEIAAQAHKSRMRDPALDYILHVLEKKDWSANRLATEAGVAASTIARPLREPDWPHHISRRTIDKIARVTGIDPTPFLPAPAESTVGFAEQISTKLRANVETQLGQPYITVSIHDGVAEIRAIVNRDGLAKLRAKLDAIEQMLTD